MAQLAIAINVSGRVVYERRRCDTKKKAPVASKRMAGAGLDIHAAVLVRQAQRTFDATPALLNQSWPRLQRPPLKKLEPPRIH